MSTAQTVKDYTEGFDVTNITEDTEIAVTELDPITVTVIDGVEGTEDDAWDFYFGTSGTLTTNAAVQSRGWYGVVLTIEHTGWTDGSPRTFTFEVDGATWANADVATDNGGSVTGTDSDGTNDGKITQNFQLENVVGPVTIKIAAVD